MIEAFVQGLIDIVQPGVLIYITAAVVIGLIMGIIPGLGGSTAAILTLPFIFGMEPVYALALMTSFLAVSYTGGSMSAILLGIPGVPGNVATILDGFPITRRGEGGRAVGAAIFSSTMGGIVSVLFAFVMIPLVIPFVLEFRSPEMFFLIVVGLCFLAVLSRESLMKGLISGGLGLLMSFIGFQAITGQPRFTFGNVYLLDGIHIMVAMMGIFAVPLVLEYMIGGKTIAPPDMSTAGKVSELFKGLKDVLHHWWLWLRSSVIGYIVGVIPGIGGETAIWVAYGQAKETSKEPEKFGTGIIEGVIAPESANNAKNAGGFLTTLAFGLPGSGAMVIILAAFIIVGIQPGPRMLLDHTALCFSVLLVLALSQLIAGIICFFGAPYLIKVTRISAIYLFVFIVPLIFIGAFALNRVMIDLVILLIIGLITICAKKSGYPLVPLIIGFILGGFAEYYFWHSLDLHGALFFLTPISLVLIFLAVILLFRGKITPIFKRLFKRRIKRAS